MSKLVQIGSNTYNLPLQSENAPWGEELSDIVEAIINGLNTLQGPNDIVETSAVILNTAGAKEITAFHFNSASVRSFQATYNISRKINKAITGYVGDGVTCVITLAYNHDLKDGDIVSINTSSGIDGSYVITKLTDTTFSISSAFNGSGAAGQFLVELIESGTIDGNYSLQGWEISQERLDKTHVDLNINSSGTITYEPTLLDGTSHEGLIKFLAKSVLNS